MPCYLTKTFPVSREEFARWERIGYTGTYEQYEALKHKGQLTTIIMCGSLGPHCASCMAPGNFMCDFPVGENKTCDRSMCLDHAHEVGHDLHYCEAHYEIWRDFVNAGGVSDALKNVVAFKTEK